MKIDSRWIGLQGPTRRISWIQNELAATMAIRPTQIQPTVRCGSVPFGRGELDQTQRKGGHRRKGMKGDRGSGIQQRREAHWKLTGGFIAKT